MGVIQRQSFKYTVVNFVGLLIGIASTLFIYPHVTEAYGLFQWLLSVGIVGLPLISMGANVVAVRFFPKFEDNASGHHGFIPLLFTLIGIGSAFVLLVLLVSWPWIADAFADSPIKRQYAWAAFPVGVLFVSNLVLFQYSTNFKRIVVPSILTEFSLKIVQPILMVGVWLGFIELGVAVYGLLAYNVLILVSMVFYLKYVLGQWSLKPDWGHLNPTLRKDLRQFILTFGSFGQMAIIMASKLDTFLVGSISTLSNAGVYNIAVNISAVVEIPTKGLYAASISSVSRYINDENWDELRDLYRKVSINLLSVGLFIYGGVLVSVHDLYAIIANTEVVSVGKIVLVIIGASKLVEMSTSLNNYIMYYSPYYRQSLLAQGSMALLNLGLSIWLIPKYGIAGAAWPTLVSITGYNAINVVLVWQKYKLFPFTSKTLVALLIAAAAFLLVQLIPSTAQPLLNIVVRSGAFAVLFLLPLFWLRLSPDLNEMIAKGLRLKAKG